MSADCWSDLFKVQQCRLSVQLSGVLATVFNSTTMEPTQNGKYLSSLNHLKAMRFFGDHLTTKLTTNVILVNIYALIDIRVT